jgi:hypothetical protein
MPRLDPPEEYRWKPGQSGNPRGRLKGRTLTDKILDLIASGRVDNVKLPEGQDVGDALARVAVVQALKGDFRFWNAILDRTEGKVPDRIELDDARRLPDDELVARADAVLALRRGAGDPGGNGAAGPAG